MMDSETFRNRREAGRILADLLQEYAGRADVTVLALPRGGVPVGYEVARSLEAPLDVFVVRKLGVPGHEELAMGAIASGGVRVVNEKVAAMIPDAASVLDRVAAQEQQELQRREAQYRAGRPSPELVEKTVILVDDGLATGATMRAAVMALRQIDVARCVAAVPVASADTCAEFRGEVDELVCARTPQTFYGVGQFYDDFTQTTDEEVEEFLRLAASGDAGGRNFAKNVMSIEREITLPAGNVVLEGNLEVPDEASGIVLFVHGSGSSRHSSRNRFVAEILNDAGFATLLFDLLTREEEAEDLQTAHLRFDIPFLAGRLAAASNWILRQADLSKLPVGYFGSSTGGGAALVAAAEHPERVGAIVSRGGRPDLAGSALPEVRTPTLLVVGGADEAVIEMNRAAMEQMRCKVQLELVPRATHLFEEPGTLEQAARLAADWFQQHLAGTP